MTLASKKICLCCVSLYYKKSVLFYSAGTPLRTNGLIEIFLCVYSVEKKTFKGNSSLLATAHTNNTQLFLLKWDVTDVFAQKDKIC